MPTRRIAVKCVLFPREHKLAHVAYWAIECSSIVLAAFGSAF